MNSNILKVLENEIPQEIIREIIVKSWNNSYNKSQTNDENIISTKSEFQVLMNEYLLNLHYEKYILFEHKLELNNYLLHLFNKESKEWLYKLISLNKNNGILNEEDVKDPNFPSNIWYQVDFN